MAKTNEELAREIAEERRKEAGEKYAPVKVDNQQITGAKIAWMLGAFAVDVTTAYAIWQILFWWYGVAWVIAGAGGIVYSDWLRERVGNNETQKKIADVGLNLSWIAIVVMAVFSGVALVFGIEKNPYVEGFAIIFVLGLFLYHVLQSYRYSINDDEYIERTKEARANELANKRIREIHRAARIVEARKRAEQTLDEYKREHGAAMEALLAGQTPVSPPMVSFASETEVAGELQTINPTNAGMSKHPPK